MAWSPLKIKERFGEEFRFFREWMREPAAVGSIVPTGKAAARAMAACVPLGSDLPVLELGPGTGAITEAILQRGIAPEKIVSVEYSKEFCDFLRERFPDVNFINGDAFNLAETLKGTPWRRFCAVVSGIPLLNFPKPERTRLIRDALSFAEPGAPFIQISYGPKPPAAAVKGVFSVQTTDWVVKNVPPARVFVYRMQDLP